MGFSLWNLDLHFFFLEKYIEIDGYNWDRYFIIFIEKATISLILSLVFEEI